MDRINVFEDDTEDGYGPVSRRLAGWFDRDRATRVVGRREFDGENMADVHVGANRGQNLYRTAKGRYVLETWSAWVNEDTTFEFISPDQAREWLTIDGEDDLVTKWFGELEEEAGPEPEPRVGRPAVGDTTTIRLGEDLTARVDAARVDGESRAAAIRRLLQQALA